MKAILKRIICLFGVHDWKIMWIGPVDLSKRCRVCRRKKHVKRI